ncbi:TspO/MBR family protein [Actinokineospora sp. NPDC004072]
MTASVPRPRQIAGLIGFGAAVAVVAVVGSLAAVSSSSTYQELRLPAWAPPSWLFGPVWTALYVLIAISGWLVWRKHGFTGSLVLYAVQLVLNAAWTPLFFAARAYGWALVDIVALLIVIAVLLVAFYRKHRVAAFLLIPYLAWVAFATALNASIVAMN